MKHQNKRREIIKQRHSKRCCTDGISSPTVAVLVFTAEVEKKPEVLVRETVKREKPPLMWRRRLRGGYIISGAVLRQD